ncbi:hypothetical protein P7K49_001168, partial [Saguinus oedipus]
YTMSLTGPSSATEGAVDVKRPHTEPGTLSEKVSRTLPRSFFSYCTGLLFPFTRCRQASWEAAAVARQEGAVAGTLVE